jgi:membrane-associated protease RseP (regulator of RpoE activity)
MSEDEEAATEERPAVDADAPTETHDAVTAPESADGTAPEPAAEPRARSYVRVPTWIAVVLAAVVLLGGGFALGRVTAPDDDGDELSIQVPAGQGREIIPGPIESPAFLGVVTQPAEGGAGVEILRVSEGSAADDGGLQEGDVITEVDGEAVADPSALRVAIAAHEPGDEVTITFQRDGEEQEATIELDDRPVEGDTPNN